MDENKQEIELAPAPPSPVDVPIEAGMSVDDHLIQMQYRESKMAPAPVQDPNTMAHAIAAASNGTVSYEESVKQLVTSGWDSGQPIRQHAASLYLKDAAEARLMFDQQASLGMVNEAASTANVIDYYNRIRENIPLEKAVAKVYKEASANLATTNTATIENNSPQRIYEVAEQVGEDAAMRELVMQYMVQKGIAPTESEMLGFFTGALALPLNLAVVGAGSALVPGLGVAGAAGTAIGTVMGLKFAKDAFYDVTKAIESVSGIKASPISYAEQINEWKQRLRKMPKEQALAEFDKVAEQIVASQSFGTTVAGKAMIMLNLMKLSDKFNEDEWSKFELSSKTNEWLDRAGLVLDMIPVAGAVKSFLKNGLSISKTLSELTGAGAVGRSIGKDIVDGTNKMGETGGSQVGYALSMDLGQYLPDGVVGTSAAVQAEIKASLQAAIEKLNNSVRIDANPETLAMRDFLVRHSKNYSTNVVSSNLESGEMVLQHNSGNPFRNVDNAKSFAARMEKETGLKWDVVPANDGVTAKTARYDFNAEYGDVDPNLSNLFEEARTGTFDPFGPGRLTAQSMMEEIAASKSATPVEKIIAKSLSKLSALDNVGVELFSDANDLVKRLPHLKVSGEGAGLAGKYEWRTNKVYLQKDFAPSRSLVLHETLHAAISQMVDVVRVGGKDMRKIAGVSPKQIAAVENIRDIYKDVQFQISRGIDTGEFSMFDASSYGMKDVHEFISEGLTNKAFMDMLKKIKLSDDTLDAMRSTDAGFLGKVKDAYSAFTKAIMKALGLTPDNENAFMRFVEESNKLISSMDVEQQNLKTALQAAGYSTAQMSKVFDTDMKAALAHGWYVKHAGNPMLHTGKDIDSRFGAGLDPVHRASEESVHERTLTLLAEQKDRNALKKFLDDGFKGLSRKDHARVVKALEEGDELQREWNVAELIARGVSSDKAQKAYFTYRTLSNLDLAVKNVTLNENLTRRGFVQGYIKNGTITHFAPAKNIPLSEAEGKLAYNLVAGKTERVDSAKMTGLTVVETAKPVKIGSEEYTRFISDNTTITYGRLRSQIPNRKGSFRHYYTQDYFGDVKISRVVNGETIEDTLHLRTSNSGKDISKWQDGMNALLKQHKSSPGSVTLTQIENLVGKWEDPQAIYNSMIKGEWDNYKTFGNHYDRANDQYIETLAKAQWDDDLAKADGRGIRLKSIDSDKANILDPISAIEAELTNVARHRNIDEWRDKWVNTWWNTFSETLPNHIKNSGRSPLQVMSSPELQMSTYTRGDNFGKFAESQRKYILAQLGTRTADERLIETVVQRLTANFGSDTTLFGMPVGEKLITAGHVLRNADPLQFARSFNFFTMLSAFNPAQLIVQGAGAVNAIAVSPLHGMKAAFMAPALRMALASDNPAVWQSIAKLDTYAKLGLDSSADFVKTVRAIKKLGLMDGIVSTSMHNAEAGRFNMFTGTMSKAGEKSAFFFNRGEEFARLVAFDVAKREYIAAGAKVWDNDAGLRHILTRTDDLTQNMMRSNLAFYQRGVLSIPGQFLQYNIKLAMNLSGAAYAATTGKPYRGYTAGEATSILAMHTVLYGMAGNGLMMLADEIVGGYEKLVGREVTDDEKLTFSQGAIAGLINELSQSFTGQDTKLAIGSRLGVFEYYEKLAKTISQGDSSFWEVALGPSYGSATRLGAIKALAEPFVRKDLSIEAFGEAFNTVGKELFSGWRNGSKAYYAQLHEGALPDKEGTAMATLTKGEIIAQAIGIGSSVEQDYWRLRLGIKERRKAVEEFAKAYLDTEKVSLEVLKNEGESVRYKTLTNYMTTLHSELPSGERELFWDIVKKPRGVEKTAPFIDQQTQIRAEHLDGSWNVKDYLSTRSRGLTDLKPVENK